MNGQTFKLFYILLPTFPYGSELKLLSMPWFDPSDVDVDAKHRPSTEQPRAASPTTTIP